MGTFGSLAMTVHVAWQGHGLPMMALPPAESMTSAQLGRAALSISRSPTGAQKRKIAEGLRDLGWLQACERKKAK